MQSASSASDIPHKSVVHTAFCGPRRNPRVQHSAVGTNQLQTIDCVTKSAMHLAVTAKADRFSHSFSFDSTTVGRLVGSFSIIALQSSRNGGGVGAPSGSIISLSTTSDMAVNGAQREEPICVKLFFQSLITSLSHDDVVGFITALMHVRAVK